MRHRTACSAFFIGLFFCASAAPAGPDDIEGFDQRVPVPQGSTISLHAFAAWRFGFGPRWMEAGLRAFNLLNTPYYDYPGTVNPEGIDVGGELLVRRITLYVRGVR